MLTSDVPHAPVKRRRSRFEQQILLSVAVGFTTLIIAGLYAASFDARRAMRVEDVDHPRWSLLGEDFIDKISPAKENLTGVKKSLSNLVGAGQTQVSAAAILKAKIEARAAASGTPETPETPETP